MKKYIIIGGLVLFAYAGFQPPDGMRKFPVANVQFDVQTPKGNFTARIDTTEKTENIDQDEQEKQAN